MKISLMATNQKVKINLSIAVLFSLLFSLCLLQAQLKLTNNIDLLDVVSEGALLVLGASWLVLILSARPGGRVTWLLTIGLTGYCLGCYMDLLDEFFVSESLPSWFKFFEKIPTPLGLIVLTVGLWLWRDEQATINEQLRTREQFYREHQLVDQLTLLCDARAMRIQLNHNMAKFQSTALIMLDLDNFNQINIKYGFSQGDQRLINIAQMLAVQLRTQDLVCRYAGDRFIIMLPNCSETFADAMAIELINAIKKLDCQASYAIEFLPIEGKKNINNAEEFIEQVNIKLEQVKQQCWPKAI